MKKRRARRQTRELISRARCVFLDVVAKSRSNRSLRVLFLSIPAPLLEDPRFECGSSFGVLGVR